MERMRESASHFLLSSTILEFVALLGVFSSLFSFLRHIFTRPKFMDRWSIDVADGADMANKSVSGLFGIICFFLGLRIMFVTRNGKIESYDLLDDLVRSLPNGPPDVADGMGSVEFDHVLLFAMAYFVYDFFCMYQVYCARRSRNYFGNFSCSMAIGKSLKSKVSPGSFSATMQSSTSCSPCALRVTGFPNVEDMKDRDAPPLFSDIANVPEDRNLKGSPILPPKVTTAALWSFLAENPVMAAHHLALALFFLPMMMRFYDHKPGSLMVACALLMETSTPFVSLRRILSQLGMKKTKLYFFNGMIMGMVFFCCRILIFPLFYYVYGVRTGLSFYSALACTPLQCRVWIAIVFLPQVYWFIIIVRGSIVLMNKSEKYGEYEEKKTE